MKSLLHPPQPSISVRVPNPTLYSSPSPSPSLTFSRHRWINRQKLRLTLKAALDSAILDQLGIPESDIKNPALSSSYRISGLPKPNQTVLDAQARVCTGPTQTRPLNEDQTFKVLDTILRSGKLVKALVGLKSLIKIIDFLFFFS